MGFALAYGIAKNQLYKKENIVFIEKNNKRISFLKDNSYKVFKSLSQALNKHKNNIEVIILAVKPGDISLVLKELKKSVNKKTIIVSIAAGINLKRMLSLLPRQQPIVRVMPNTPAMVGEGMSAITYKHLNKNQKQTVNKIFQAIGKTLTIEENKFDLITAISGSGPAYFCYLIECLANSAKKLGLTREASLTLVLQTALGTIALLTKEKISPKQLRERVTSQKGTTEAAIKTLQKNNFNNIIHSAIQAAKKRAGELALSFLIVLTPLCSLSLPVFSQDPIMIGTETEDIALTDDVNIAKLQVEKYPENPEAHFNLAIALSRTSFVEQAIKELRKTKILIRKPENTGTIEKKINEYNEIIKENPEANNIRYRLAFCHYLKAYLITKDLEKLNKTSTKKKSDLFGSRLQLNDKNPEIKKNLDLSIHYFNEILKLNPNDSWAKIYYAFILTEQFNEIEKARVLWTEVLNQDPNNPAPHFFIGELHIKEGNLKEGILEISQAILLRSQGY